MSSSGVGPARTARPSWSLAAGRAATPRVGWFALSVLVVAIVDATRAIGTNEDDGSFRPWNMSPHAIEWALVAWVAWLLVGHRLIRALGESRRRFGGGSTGPRRGRVAAARRIDEGLQGAHSYVSWTVASVMTYCVCCLALAESSGAMYAQIIVRWVPTHWAIAVATYALPVAFLALIVGPRLLRGRLVVSWPTSPQFEGGRCAFDLRTSSRPGRIDGVRVFLRCFRTSRRAIPILPRWNERLAWVAEARLPLGAHVGPDDALRFEFDMPTNASEIESHAADAARWELLVLGTVGSSDYTDAVVVPVYEATN